jgi:hypothetical protein
LGVGQGVKSVGQVGHLDRSVDLGLDFGELIGVMVELDTELPAGRVLTHVVDSPSLEHVYPTVAAAVDAAGGGRPRPTRRRRRDP